MLENNIAIVVSCMPAFAVFIKQNVFEASVFKSLRSALTFSGKRLGNSVSHPRRWAGIGFGGGSDKSKEAPKQEDERLPLDSYLELNDGSELEVISPVAQSTQPKDSIWATTNMVISQPPHSHPTYFSYGPSQDGILRTTQVEQTFSLITT